MAKEFTIRMETKKFNDHVQKMIKQYPEKANSVLKKFAFDLLRLIVSNTSDYRHPV